MIIDIANQVATAYAPTAFGATLNFQNYIDLMVAQDEAAGMGVKVLGTIATAVTSAGAATIDFQVIGNATDPTFAAGNVVLLDTGLIPKATLGLGYQFLRAELPRIPLLGSLETTPAFLRYLTVVAIIGTANLTAGAWNIWFGFGPLQDNLSYPAGYSFP